MGNVVLDSYNIVCVTYRGMRGSTRWKCEMNARKSIARRNNLLQYIISLCERRGELERQ